MKKILRFALNNLQLFAEEPILAVNDVSVDIASKALENYFQDDVEPSDKGVNSSLVEDEAYKNGRIRIYKAGVLPVRPRTLGAAINGTQFSNEYNYPSNGEYWIDVLCTHDTAIPVAETQEDMCSKLRLRQNYAAQIGKANIKIKNGVCLAAKFYHSYLKDVAHVSQVTFTEGTDDFSDKIADTISALNEGDQDNGVDIFPEEMSRIIYSPKAQAYFNKAKKAGIIVGGSNLAQEMVAKGVISPGAERDILGSGFIGVYANTPCNMMSLAKFQVADEFLGFPKGTINDFVLAVNSSAYANYYGFVDKGVKVNPKPDGNGVYIVPNYRFGANTFFTKGNVWIVKANTTNPYAIYTTLGGTQAGTTFGSTWAPKLIAPGSRANLTVTLSSPAATGATIAVTGLKESKAVALWYVAATEAKTIQEFIAGYNAAASGKKGAVEVSTAGAGTISGSSLSNKFNVLVFDADGTIGGIAHATIA